ncbi:MAG TPA: sugar transferase [Candidatus Acidoferrales bacterium]|nr:sugar transferase [Candidatus Acidoferrales bacterium]
MTRRPSHLVPVRSVILGLSEAVVATFAFVAAMFAYLGPLNTKLAMDYQRADARVAFVVGVFVLCMYYFDMYNLSVLRNSFGLAANITRCVGALFLILACTYAVVPSLRLQDQILLTGTGAAAVAAVGWRHLFRYATHWPLLQERVLILGEGELGDELAGILTKRPELGYRVVQRFANESISTLDENGVDFALQELVEARNIRRVIVTMGERRGRLPVNTLLALKEQGILIQDGSEFYENITGKVYLSSLRPSMLLFSPAFEISSLSLLLKRVFSIVFSIAALIIMGPIMLAVAIAIKLDSPGPIIFRQERVGYKGKRFTLYKFRSMRDGADSVRPAEENDERFTRVGLWLRAWRIDELPQFWNILIGDMHLVGPRPFVPEQEDYLRERLPFYKLRWSIHPGATGWAQVSRGYCSTLEDNADKLACDLFYLKHCSIGLDLLVVFKTLKILLLGRGAR